MNTNSIESIKRNKNKIGMAVFLTLTVLTIIEFVIALSSTKLAALLILVALAKATLIVIYFMHIRKVFSDSEE
jgi:caa(3)-type oxidase subunit IV